MNTRTAWLVLVLIAAAISGCSTPEPQTSTSEPPGETGPEALSNGDIVLAMVERLNAGDVEGSLAYFAEDARVYLMGFPPTGIEHYFGTDQIRFLWEDSVAAHFQWEVEVTNEANGLVFLDTRTWHDFTREIGVAPLAYTDIYELVDGKIITYASWMTEESLARFKPAFAAAMPPGEPPTPVVDPAVSELSVTIAGGTCRADAPLALKAGEITVHLDVQDQDNSAFALTIFTLAEGKDFLDLMVSTAGWQPGWANSVLMVESGPGTTETYSFTVQDGPAYLICWSKPPDTPIGNAGPFEVVP